MCTRFRISIQFCICKLMLQYYVYGLIRVCCNVQWNDDQYKTVELMLRIYFPKGVFILIHFDYRAKIRCWSSWRLRTQYNIPANRYIDLIPILVRFRKFNEINQSFFFLLLILFVFLFIKKNYRRKEHHTMSIYGSKVFVKLKFKLHFSAN